MTISKTNNCNDLKSPCIIIDRITNGKAEVFIRSLWDGTEVQFENYACAEKALRNRNYS